jgi:hypothetical protein
MVGSLALLLLHASQVRARLLRFSETLVNPTDKNGNTVIRVQFANWAMSQRDAILAVFY